MVSGAKKFHKIESLVVISHFQWGSNPIRKLHNLNDPSESTLDIFLGKTSVVIFCDSGFPAPPDILQL